MKEEKKRTVEFEMGVFLVAASGPWGVLERCRKGRRGGEGGENSKKRKRRLTCLDAGSTIRGGFLG